MSVVYQKQLTRRTEIIGRSMDLLKTVPYERVTVQDICEAAGISVGSFYHYFNQKSDILVGLMQLIDVYMTENVFPHLTHDSELENLKEISRGFAHYIMECGIEQARLVTSCQLTLLDPVHEQRPLRRKLVEVIARGQAVGELANVFTPEKTADLLLVAMSGVAVDWSRRDGAFSIVKQMEDFTNMFFPALLG